MLAVLMPLFDENMVVSSYSLFSQKKNLFMDPRYSGTAANDGVGTINGLEIIENMGIETLSSDKDIFVPVNHISVFTNIESQCKAPKSRIVLLIDNSVEPSEMYVKRLMELKKEGYKLAIRKLQVMYFESFRPILLLMDYIFLNPRKIDIEKATIYFTKMYPNVKLIAEGIQSVDEFETLKARGGYQYYEGEFYRLPVTKGVTEVAPLKINYIGLLNMVNNPDYDLTDAAEIIGRDTALVIDLLKIVNKMARNSEITSIKHAAAMLGQKELKKWITTAATRQLCQDKPNEITRLSLLRAKFAENLADTFDMKLQSEELFLLGLFSVLDIIIDKPMEEALQVVNVSKAIREALLDHKGNLYKVLSFMNEYENANWQEVSRLIIVDELDMNSVYESYTSALAWYRELFA